MSERTCKWMLCALLGVLVSGLYACASPDRLHAPRYVWYCHIAGGAGCIGEMIRCWDSKRLTWVEDSYCAAVDKPANLVHNQSYPPVSGSALFPGNR